MPFWHTTVALWNEAAATIAGPQTRLMPPPRVRADSMNGSSAGPEGKGAGHKIATFTKTEFAPEAYLRSLLDIRPRRRALQRPGMTCSVLAKNMQSSNASSSWRSPGPVWW